MTTDFTTTKLIIPGHGHVFYNNVDTDMFDLSKFVFGTASTYGTWKWAGDHSRETLPEFKRDGGEATSQGTWDRDNVQTGYTPETLTFNLALVDVSAASLAAFDPTGVLDTVVGSFAPSGKPTNKAIAVVFSDATGSAALVLYNTSIKVALFEKLDTEKFVEIPVSGAVNFSTKAPQGYRWIQPTVFVPAP